MAIWWSTSSSTWKNQTFHPQIEIRCKEECRKVPSSQSSVANPQQHWCCEPQAYDPAQSAMLLLTADYPSLRNLSKPLRPHHLIRWKTELSKGSPIHFKRNWRTMLESPRLAICHRELRTKALTWCNKQKTVIKLIDQTELWYTLVRCIVIIKGIYYFCSLFIIPQPASTKNTIKHYSTPMWWKLI